MPADVSAAPAVAPLASVQVRYDRTALVSAGLVTGVAGMVHLAVVPDHLREYLPFGVFFVVIGLGQLAAGVALLVRPSRRLLLAVAAAAVALVGLWLVSRTGGLPVGPDPGSPEPVGVPDVVCVALEMLAVGILLLLVRRGPRPPRARRARTVLAAAPVVLLAIVAAVIGVGTGLSGMPVAFSAASDPDGVPVTALVAAPGSEPVRSFTLTAAPGFVDGHLVEAYNGTVPGPELRVTQGDRVRVTLANRLPVATTLHWHGVRVPDAADGVAGITQDAVAPGRSFTYEFVAADAGTFWYHSHQDTGHRIPAGLFGALVVEPAGGRVAEEVDDTALLHTSPDGAIGVNGTTGVLHLHARPGRTVRLRVINAVTPDMDGTVQAPALLGVMVKP